MPLLWQPLGHFESPAVLAIFPKPRLLSLTGVSSYFPVGCGFESRNLCPSDSSLDPPFSSS